MRKRKTTVSTKRRQTIQKQAVLDAVRQATLSHPTAADIFAQVRPLLPTLSFGTVYRVLHGLVEEGEIAEIRQAGGPAHYDADTREHDHIICSRCGAVGDVHLRPLFSLEECGQPQTDFEVLGYRLEFHGLCPSCRLVSQAPVLPFPVREVFPC